MSWPARSALPVPALVTVDVAPGARRGGAGRRGAGAAAALRRASTSAWTTCPARWTSRPGPTASIPELAGRVLWFDALVGNVDRSWRNPNMLFWHGRLQLIDHGAALTFHHNWPGAAAAVARPYDATRARADRVRARRARRRRRPGAAGHPALLTDVLAAGARRVAGGRRRPPDAVRRAVRRPAARPAGGPRGVAARAGRRGRGRRRRAPPRRRAGRTGRPGWARRRRRG